MSSLSDFATRGKVIAVRSGSIVFQPKDTNYELHLATREQYDGPINVPVSALIRATVRKLLTVSSGGAFIAPIFGPPRTVQGRVRHVGEEAIVAQAGLSVILDLPRADHAVDLNTGPIGIGTMVNAIVLAGATFELLSSSTTAEIR